MSDGDYSEGENVYDYDEDLQVSLPADLQTKSLAQYSPWNGGSEDAVETGPEGVDASENGSGTPAGRDPYACFFDGPEHDEVEEKRARIREARLALGKEKEMEVVRARRLEEQKQIRLQEEALERQRTEEQERLQRQQAEASAILNADGNESETDVLARDSLRRLSEAFSDSERGSDISVSYKPKRSRAASSKSSLEMDVDEIRKEIRDRSQSQLERERERKERHKKEKFNMMVRGTRHAKVTLYGLFMYLVLMLRGAALGKAAVAEKTAIRLAEEQGLLTQAKGKGDKKSTYWAQGNIEFYRKDYYMKRRLLRYHPKVDKAVSAFWGICKLNDEGRLEKIPYMMVSIKIYKVLVETYGGVFDRLDGIQVVQEDWDQDRKGQSIMTYKMFCDSIYELCDMWTDQVDADEYVSFLNQLLVKTKAEWDIPVVDEVKERTKGKARTVSQKEHGPELSGDWQPSVTYSKGAPDLGRAVKSRLNTEAKLVDAVPTISNEDLLEIMKDSEYEFRRALFGQAFQRHMDKYDRMMGVATLQSSYVPRFMESYRRKVRNMEVSGIHDDPGKVISDITVNTDVYEYELGPMTAPTGTGAPVRTYSFSTALPTPGTAPGRLHHREIGIRRSSTAASGLLSAESRWFPGSPALHQVRDEDGGLLFTPPLTPHLTGPSGPAGGMPAPTPKSAGSRRSATPGSPKDGTPPTAKRTLSKHTRIIKAALLQKAQGGSESSLTPKSNRVKSRASNGKAGPSRGEFDWGDLPNPSPLANRKGSVATDVGTDGVVLNYYTNDISPTSYVQLMAPPIPNRPADADVAPTGPAEHVSLGLPRDSVVQMTPPSRPEVAHSFDETSRRFACRSPQTETKHDYSMKRMTPGSFNQRIALPELSFEEIESELEQFEDIFVEPRSGILDSKTEYYCLHRPFNATEHRRDRFLNKQVQQTETKRKGLESLLKSTRRDDAPPLDRAATSNSFVRRPVDLKSLLRDDTDRPKTASPKRSPLSSKSASIPKGQVRRTNSRVRKAAQSPQLDENHDAPKSSGNPEAVHMPVAQPRAVMRWAG